MRTLLPLILLLAVPLTPLAQANAADDAGCRCDAGDDQASATPAPWSLQGNLTSDDEADWYRIDGTGRRILSFILVGTVSTWVSVTTPEGRSLGTAFVTPSDPEETATFGIVDDVTYLQVRTYFAGSSGAYSLHVEDLGPAPDLRVLDLVLTPREPHDHEPFGARDVLVTVDNAGPGAASGILLVRSSATLGGRTLAELHVALAPGESQVVRVSWDSTGQAGRVSVSATLRAAHDLDPENNARSVDTHVAADLPAGVDPGFRHTVCQGAYGNYVCILTPHHEQGVWKAGLLTSVFGTSLVTAWANVHVFLGLTEGGPDPAICVAVGPTPALSRCLP